MAILRNQPITCRRLTGGVITLDLSNGAVTMYDTGLLTQSAEDERGTVQVKSTSGAVVAETDDCPGIHGEAAAQH